MSSGPFASPVPPSATTAAITLYVDPLGNDANPGTSPGASACLTIQGALNKVPKSIRHKCVVNVGAGNYAGFVLDGFDTQLPAFANYSGLEIRGTMAPATVGPGTNSGTISGYTAASGATPAIITDAGQTWTVDALKGKFLVLLSGTGFPGTETIPAILPIISNTATTVTVLGPTTAVGATYQIQEPATNINAPAGVFSNPAGAIPGALQAVNLGFVLVGPAIQIGSCSGGFLGLSRLKITQGASLSTGIDLGTGALHMVAVAMVAPAGNSIATMVTTGAGAVWGVLGQFRATQCIFQVPNNCSAIGCRGNPSIIHRIRSCFFEALSSSSSFGIQPGGGRVLVQFSVLKKFTYAFSVLDGCPDLTLASVLIDGDNVANSIGIDALPFATTVWMGVLAQLTTTIISNCTTALRLAANASVRLKTCSGTGNTTGIQLTEGARIKVASDTTLTGTSEVTLDGAAATTLAAMRAASPKLLTNTYGTIIYE